MLCQPNIWPSHVFQHTWERLGRSGRFGDVMMTYSPSFFLPWFVEMVAEMSSLYHQIDHAFWICLVCIEKHGKAWVWGSTAKHDGCFDLISVSSACVHGLYLEITFYLPLPLYIVPWRQRSEWETHWQILVYTDGLWFQQIESSFHWMMFVFKSLSVHW